MSANSSDDDPYASIIRLCNVSSSQEELLRRCPFTFDPYDSQNDTSSEADDGIRVESIGIVMVSPPESPDLEGSNTSQDVFQTPPEHSAPPSDDEHHSPITVDCSGTEGGSGRAVDLNRDSDSLFSDFELTQRTARSKLCFKEGFGGYPLNKLKTLEQEYDQSTLRLDSHGVILDENKSGSSGKSESHCSGEEFDDESSAKRKLKFSDKNTATGIVLTDNDSEDRVLELGNDERGGENGPGDRVGCNLIELKNDSKRNLSTAEFVETMQMLQQDSTSSLQETVDTQPATPRRKLPSSFQWQVNAENTAKRVHCDSMSDKGHGEVNFLDVLKILGQGCHDSVPCRSLLDIYKQRGMTLPWPLWWPGGGFNLET